MMWAQTLDYICSHVCNKIHFSCQFIYNVDVSLNTKDWENVLVSSGLSSVRVYWVGLDMTFLKLKYIQ